MAVQRQQDAVLTIRPVEHVLVKQTPAFRGNYAWRRRRKHVRFIVLHCTDGHEGIHKDDDVAAMFARRNLKPRRSCHYVVDTDSATQCVPDAYAAWHCGRNGNRWGIGIELCGRARQTRQQWLDELSLPMLRIASRLTADLCHRHGIEPVFLDHNALRAGGRGITSHVEVGAAWRQTRHTDPGPNFPLDLFMKAVVMAYLTTSPPSSPSECIV